MKRISLLEYANSKGIKTKETALKLYENQGIPNSYKDEITGAISVVVPEFEGDTEISKELKQELANLQNPNRIPLKEFAKNLGITYNKCYISFIDTGILKNIFRDSVGGKISVFITDDMYDLKIPKKDGLKPLKEVAAFLYLKDYELRAMVKEGKINYRRDTSVFSKNGHIYFSQKDVEEYVKSKKTYSSFVIETFDRGYLLSLEDVCSVLKKDAKTVVRFGEDSVLKAVYYESSNEKYEQASGKKYTVESVKDFFYNNADYRHDVRVLGLFQGDIRKFFAGGEDYKKTEGEKLKASEIYALTRIPLRIYAKKAKRSYQSLLGDFYADNLPNAGQDPVTKDIFVLRDDDKPYRTFSLDSIKKAFAFSDNRISLVQYAKQNGLPYNKAKILAKNGEIKGALYDPVCNSFSVDLDAKKNERKEIPYIRLDIKNNDGKEKAFGEPDEMSLYAFYTEYGYDITYIRLDVLRGRFQPTKKDGNKMFFSRAVIDEYLKFRENLVSDIVNLLNSKNEFSLDEMTFLTQRDATFVCRTAPRKKWLASRAGNELYSKREYLDFVRSFDKYWNESEKARILSAV